MRTAASTKLPEFTNSDQTNYNLKSKTFDKSKNSALLSPFVKSEKAKKNLSTSNNSTLSLHIAAYENSVEPDSSNNQDNSGESITKVQKNSGIGKKWKNVNQIFSESTSAKSSIEIPRQQKEEETVKSDPEIMQFKASQKLFNRNQKEIPSHDYHHQHRYQKQKEVNADPEPRLEVILKGLEDRVKAGRGNLSKLQYQRSELEFELRGLQDEKAVLDRSLAEAKLGEALVREKERQINSEFMELSDDQRKSNPAPLIKRTLILGRELFSLLLRDVAIEDTARKAYEARVTRIQAETAKKVAERSKLQERVILLQTDCEVDLEQKLHIYDEVHVLQKRAESLDAQIAMLTEWRKSSANQIKSIQTAIGNRQNLGKLESLMHAYESESQTCLWDYLDNVVLIGSGNSNSRIGYSNNDLDNVLKKLIKNPNIHRVGITRTIVSHGSESLLSLLLNQDSLENMEILLVPFLDGNHLTHRAHFTVGVFELINNHRCFFLDSLHGTPHRFFEPFVQRMVIHFGYNFAIVPPNECNQLVNHQIGNDWCAVYAFNNIEQIYFKGLNDAPRILVPFKIKSEVQRFNKILLAAEETEWPPTRQTEFESMNSIQKQLYLKF